MTRALIWSVALIVAAAALFLLIMGNVHSPLRVGLTFAFFLVGPGMAFVLWLRLADWITETTLAVALSIALTTLTSEAMIYSGIWSSNGAALGLIGWTVLGALAHLARVLRTLYAGAPHDSTQHGRLSQESPPRGNGMRGNL